MKKMQLQHFVLAALFVLCAGLYAEDALGNAAEESYDDADDGFFLFTSMGATVPYLCVHCTDCGKQNLSGVFLNAAETFVDMATGLTFKLEIALGGAHIDTLPCMKIEGAFGDSYNLALSAGYSFIRTRHTVLSLCASAALFDYVFGKDCTVFKDGITCKQKDYSVTAVFCALGSEAQFLRIIDENLFFFASVGAYYLLGAEEYEYVATSDGATHTVSKTNAVSGNFAVTPTLGLCIRY